MSAMSDNQGVEDRARRFVFDFDAYERMAEVGVFNDGRVELIEGTVVEMAPAGMDHTKVNSGLLVRLHAAVAAERMPGIDVLSNGTLRIDDLNAPEPDVFVARPPTQGKYYLAKDALLVIEVSVSTRDSDRKVKAPLYARAGVPEFWIVEPEHKTVRIYRKPLPDGGWDEETIFSDGMLSPLFAPAIQIAVSEIFGR